MKKIIAFVLTLAMVLSMASTAVYAQVDVVLKGEKAVYDVSFEKDKTFDVTFMIENNSEISHGTYCIKYDPSVIQAVKKDSATGTEGYFGYELYGQHVSFVDDFQLLNQVIDFVPAANDVDVYEGKSDGVKTSAEVGILKMVSMPYDANGLKYINMKSGKFLTIRFKVVGEGSTKVDITKASSKSSFILCKGSGSEGALNVEVQPITVNVGSGASTNEETTEATTAKDVSEATTVATTEEASTEATTEATTVAVADEVKTFNDIADYPWAKEAIEALASKGVINGVGNGMFNPSANVKRADFLLMLMNALEFEGEAKATFSDVDPNMYYANAVCLAKDLGIANGKTATEFCPNEMISRQDMMVLTANALKLKYDVPAASADALNKFSDKAEISAYAQTPLAEMVSLGIVNGTGSKLEPKANTTRAQAAVIIYNIYNKVNNK